MALKDFFKGLFQRNMQAKEASIPLFGRVVTMSSGVFSTSNKSAATYYEGWVFACVRAIAEEVAQIDLRLYRVDMDGNKELLHDHPAIKSLNQVNDYFTKHQLFERLQSDLELEGNEYWFLQPAKNGLFEIYPLVPKLVRPVVDSKNYVARFDYTVDGGNIIPLKKEQVIHFRNFNPTSDVIGMSTLSAVKNAVDTDVAAKEYNKSYFKNSAVPGIVLEYPQSLSPEEISKLKTQWNEEYGGMRNGYKTAVASDGLKVTTLSTSHSDMEFIEQRRFSRDEILAIFRVPKIIVGVMEDVNRASAEAAIFAFMQWTILPKMRRIVDTLNEFYLPLFGDSTLRFEFANKPPEDKASQSAWYQSGINNGWLSPNDIRRMEGLPEVQGGEALFLPLSLIEYGQPEAQKSIVSRDPVKKAAEHVGKALSDIFSEGMERVEERAKKEAMDDFEKKGEAKNRAQIRRAVAHEKLIMKATKKLFEGQKQRAVEGLQAYLSKKSWRNYKASKIIPVLDKKKEIDITIDLLTPIIEQIYKEEGKAGLEALGLDQVFDVTRSNVQQAIKDSTSLLSETMTTTTIETLSDSIIEGLDEGEAITDLTKRITDSLGFSNDRAARIARTETTRAGSQAEIAAWEDSDVVESLIWYTAQDERVDKECGALHGTSVDIGDAFISSGELEDLGEDDYFGNGIDSPPRHPNCRCTLIPVLKEGKSAKPSKRSFVDAIRP